MKRITIFIASALVTMGAVQAQEDAATMDELLQQIERGQARDSREAQEREARFAQARNEQQNLLNQARAERTRQENTSARLERLFNDNQDRIVSARAALDERLGALKELFGVLQTVSGDAQGRFNTSLTNIQYPDREDFLVALGGKMAGASSLASIEEIEQLDSSHLFFDPFDWPEYCAVSWSNVPIRSMKRLLTLDQSGDHEYSDAWDDEASYRDSWNFVA